MAGAPAPGPRQPRRGPAPFASFDHDVSDESSPESKQTFQLPEIREDPAGASSGGAGLAPPEQRPRSASTPGPGAGAAAAAGALRAPAAPRIDISRASSSSHHDSRDSSPELALFAGCAEEGARTRLELGFREDGALELRSSTEELAFLESAPAAPPPAAAAAAAAPRRHSRKDSQGSEAALLAVSGRTSRLSSVGSQCSAHSALSGFSHASRVSRLSVVSGASRSPSPHKMLLETSFCGPKPIEAEPEICVAAVEERLLELARGAAPPAPPAAPPPVPAAPLAAPAAPAPPAPANTRDRREVRTEVTLESGPVARAAAPEEEKRQKETRNRARAGRERERRDAAEPEVYRNRNRSKDVIRIKLKPDDEYEEDEESEPSGDAGAEPRKPASLALGGGGCAATPERRRTPSPAGGASRKSSFCSLFKSREPVASPDSPSTALRRKKSLTEGRSRSKSRDRDRSTTPTSATKIRGSVLSLFRTPRRSAASPSPSSRGTSPGPQPAPAPAPATATAERLKYYEETGNVIHIPLRTPPDERAGLSAARPESAPLPSRAPPSPLPGAAAPTAPPAPPAPPARRTVLPDGSIIIPLHSPTERAPPAAPAAPAEPTPDSGVVTPDSRRSVTTSESRRSVVTPESRRSLVTSDSRQLDDSRNGDPRTGSSSDEGRPAAPSPGAARVAGSPGDEAAGRKRRLLFSTNVGSRDQVFCTQFSITKTPSVTSEISGSAPSFPESGPVGSGPSPPPLRDTHIAAEPEPAAPPQRARAASPGGPAEPPRDSSESEPSSGAATPAARGGSDAEQRGLVVQESFEDELPYVPTTLPLERPLALPMVPVRERGPRAATAGVRRPRAAAPPPSAPPLPAPPAAPLAAPPAAAAEKLRIKLPRRPRTASAGAPPRPDRPRTRSGGDGEPRTKAEWIDFEEVPERRKQPKRIQTLPAGAEGATGPAAEREVVFSYVEPDQCRCECHAATARRDDELPLLATPATPAHANDLSSPEEAADFVCGAAPASREADLQECLTARGSSRPSSRRH